jgi:hypothetical protein
MDDIKDINELIEYYKDECEFISSTVMDYYITFSKSKADVDFVVNIIDNVNLNVIPLLRSKCMTDRQISNIKAGNMDIFEVMFSINIPDTEEVIKTHVELVNKYIELTIYNQMFEVTHNLHRYITLLDY